MSPRRPWALAVAALVPVLFATSCTTKNVITAPGPATVPVLVISPDTLVLADTGPARTLYATTNAPGTLTWRVTSHPQWVTVSPESGTVTQKLLPILVHAAPAGLGEGMYSGRISFVSTGGGAAVDLVLGVSAHPSAAVAPPSLTFSADTSTLGLQVRNQGTGMLAWTTTPSQPWIQAIPSQGYLAAGQSITVAVSVSRSGLPVGVAGGSLTVGGNSEGGSIVVPISAAVPARPILTVSPDSLLFDYFVNHRPLHLRNDGNAALDWTASPSQSWLQLDVMSGHLAPGDTTTVNATSDRTGLGSGVYGAHVDFSIAGGAGASVGVRLLQFLQTAWSLDHNVIDAAYDRVHNRLITVSASPNRLNVLDPEGRTEQSVALSVAPLCLAVEPDGLFAAVGHSGYFSYVDLTALTVQHVYGVTCDALDIVLPGNGWTYVFPTRDQWTNIRSINLASGNESLTGGQIYAGMKGRLHPSGTVMYTTDNGLSPQQMYKFDLSGGAVAHLYDSPYWGDYPFGGNLWYSDDGTRIFGASGDVFRSTGAQGTDMTYNGQLAGAAGLRWVEHSTAANRVFTVSGLSSGYPYGVPDPTVRVYDATYLGLQGTITLPSFLIPTGQGGGTLYAGMGNYAFVNSGGTRLHVLIEAAPGSGLLDDWAVASYDVSSLPLARGRAHTPLVRARAPAWNGAHPPAAPRAASPSRAAALKMR